VTRPSGGSCPPPGERLPRRVRFPRHPLPGAHPGRVRPAVLATIYESIAEDPDRVSKPLQRPLAAFRVTRRGEYRIIFTIDEDAQVVRIHRVAHRRDAYR